MSVRSLHVTTIAPTGRCPPVSPLVQMILGQPGMAERLMVEHGDDGYGRCRVCPVGGQRGRHAFPCTLRRAAEEAATLDRARRA